ncbi:zinc-dependent alcohol dehydrogenase [Oceanibium sediminis]|uniref:zinc-dependent alcohol dehydrogenase n=1 Tax=Oceanibium sediminis TaxID=2026339 RepID=UPI000DD45EAD|nr:alcohol dehydrogenase catalytic domain-containing protein [Oceanibium sediminis]
MKALVYTGPKHLDYRDAPDPERGGNALIRVEHCGICGSDMHAWAGHDERRPAPLILGHEVAGTVIEGPMQGKRVTVNPLVGCGTCRACRAGHDNLCAERKIISMPPREGGFAELLAMRPENLVEIPEGVSSAAAALAEPIACGWHGVNLAEAILGPVGADTRALVQGGGAIGLGAALVLKARGVADIMVAEPHEERRAMIAAQGLSAFDPTREPGPDGVDLVIDGVGIAPTRAAASAAARPGGVIVHIGLGGSSEGLDIRRITLQEIAFLGSYTYTPQDFRDTAAAIFDGSLGALDWPDIRPLSEGAAAFEQIAAGQVAAPKIILTP